MIRIVLPQHLRTLAKVSQEVELPLDGIKTIRAVLEALISQVSDAAWDDPRSNNRPAPAFHPVFRLRAGPVA